MTTRACTCLYDYLGHQHFALSVSLPFLGKQQSYSTWFNFQLSLITTHVMLSIDVSDAEIRASE